MLISHLTMPEKWYKKSQELQRHANNIPKKGLCYQLNDIVGQHKAPNKAIEK
jgi:hypothetical protein